MEISTILDQIDLGAMALPEFQRGYVWNRNQVRDLMRSLYLRHPVGGLLVWVTKTEHADARGDQELAAGNVRLILDGQQRGSIEDEAEEELLLETNIWVTEQGLPEGEMQYQVVDEETGDMLAILDLAWPTGIQSGLSEPVALLIDEDVETLEVANGAGFRYFVDVNAFRDYVKHEILALELEPV